MEPNPYRSPQASVEPAPTTQPMTELGRRALAKTWRWLLVPFGALVLVQIAVILRLVVPFATAGDELSDPSRLARLAGQTLVQLLLVYLVASPTVKLWSLVKSIRAALRSPVPTSLDPVLERLRALATTVGMTTIAWTVLLTLFYLLYSIVSASR